MSIEIDDEVDMNIYGDDSEDDRESTISASTDNESTANKTGINVVADTDVKDISVKLDSIPSGNNFVRDDKKVKSAAASGTVAANDEPTKKIIKKKVARPIETQLKVQGMFPDLPEIVKEEVDVVEEVVLKPKHKTLTFQEDPMQFHAKPRDLARNALKRARDIDQNAPITNHIFSRLSFAALPLDVRLSTLLEKSTADVSTQHAIRFNYAQQLVLNYVINYERKSWS